MLSETYSVGPNVRALPHVRRQGVALLIGPKYMKQDGG
jgi:hypothetical protein